MQDVLSPLIPTTCSVRSFTQPSFWKTYRRLPEQVQRQAREAYRLFAEDPGHPSLQFKRVSQRRPVYSVRVNIDYRVLGVRDGDDMVWFWIGPHHEYDRMLKNAILASRTAAVTAF